MDCTWPGDSHSLCLTRIHYSISMFEKLMCARLDSYLKSNNILCTNQFGFRKNSNTSDAIIEFLDYVYSSLDKNRALLLYIWISQRHSIQLIMRDWWVSSSIMASELSCWAGLNLICGISNNMSQSKTPAPLCQILHWVFPKGRCWAKYFFFWTSMSCIDPQTNCALFILPTIQQFLHPTVTSTMFTPQWTGNW